MQKQNKACRPTLLLICIYSALILITGFSLAICQAFSMTQIIMSNCTNRAVPTKSNGFKLSSRRYSDGTLA